MSTDLQVANPLANVRLDILQAAIESSRSPLILTDNLRPDNPIIYSNQAFLDLTGYSPEEVIGKNCRFLQGDDTDPQTVTMLRTAVKKGEYVRVSLKNYTKAGQPFWNDLVMSPIKDSSGTTTHFMGMQLDITEQVYAVENLRLQSQALQRSNKELEQFTYATSHDLQEPLRMISSYLQLINKRYADRLDDDGATFLKFATEGAERMQTLIYDLLTLSKISTSKDNFKSVDMHEAVDRALFNLRLSVQETGADITCEKLPKVQADMVQMTQMFQNLIGNAIKYRSPSRPLSIHIGYKKSGGEHVFSIADNGIGIPKKQFSRIFIVFQRLHTHAEFEGTGVGLAICSKIIDRHGGKIWVKSTEGKGSTFLFSLPAQTNKKGSPGHE